MAWPGKIIEYIEQGKFICAWVEEDAGKRLRLLNQNGREVNLPTSRVVHHTEDALSATLGRDDSIAQLKERDQARSRLMASPRTRSTSAAIALCSARSPSPLSSTPRQPRASSDARSSGSSRSAITTISGCSGRLRIERIS